jgi:hypothetical protein
MPERRALLIKALRRVFDILQERDKASLSGNEELSKAEVDVGQKFKSLMKNNFTEEFSALFDVRKSEYFSYKYVLSVNEVGANNNALAAFAKRVALIVKNDPKEEFFCKFVEMMAHPSLAYITAELKELGF